MHGETGPRWPEDAGKRCRVWEVTWTVWDESARSRVLRDVTVFLKECFMLSIYGIFTHSVAHSREACDHVSEGGTWASVAAVKACSRLQAIVQRALSRVEKAA